MAPLGKRKRDRNDFWMFNHKRFRYHGNYCGPGWSGGKYQDSIKGKKGTSVDEFDETCRKHDAYYADTTNADRLSKADFKFFRENYGKSFKRSVAAIGVGAQGVFRKVTSFPQKNSQTGDQTMAGSKSRSRSRSPGGTPRRGRRSRPMPSTPRGTPRAASTADVRMKSRSTSRSSSRASSYSSWRGGQTRSTSVSHSLGKIGNKNKKIAPLSQMMKDGVQVCLEAGLVVNTSSCQYIGHACCPNAVVKKGFWRALMKLLLRRANKLNPDWNGVPADVAVGDQFTVEYRGNMDSGTGLLQSIVAYAAGNTQENLANQWATNFEGFSSQFTINRILYRPNASHIGSTVIYLNNAHIDVDAYSQFKMQNQTVTIATDNESDDVTNCPLTGKSYEGRGTGTKYILDSVTTVVPFICDPQYGVISKAGTTNDLAEPPSGKLFQQVTKSGKAHLDPGEIKTSTIKYRKRLPLQTFISLVWDFQNDTGPKYKLKYLGEFKFYGFEKQIDTLASTAENNIKIAYEHDLKFACRIIPHAETVTTQLYLQTLVPT